ncbi:hypothetical protein INR49_023738 [Caranx melampygus]|nr:hypothetical protein INR49_023738 [Caranx melampygus]
MERYQGRPYQLCPLHPLVFARPVVRPAKLHKNPSSLSPPLLSVLGRESESEEGGGTSGVTVPQPQPRLHYHDNQLQGYCQLPASPAQHPVSRPASYPATHPSLRPVSRPGRVRPCPAQNWQPAGVIRVSAPLARLCANIIRKHLAGTSVTDVAKIRSEKKRES